jgi:hypothetical protein
MNLPKRKQNESLVDWLTRAMQCDLDNRRYRDAMWLAQLISNIKWIERSPEDSAPDSADCCPVCGVYDDCVCPDDTEMPS